MIINHNIAALNTYRQFGTANNAQASSMEKLSSGLRINKAGDDAAGLAISEKMRGQIRGLDQASRNAQDGISLIQTGEGALNETHDILQRMRELAVQSSNDTNTDDDRAEIQKEVTQLAEEVTRIAKNTEFNTQNLLDGSFSAKFQIGSNAGQNLEISIDAMDATTLAVGTGGVTTYTGGSVADKTGDATALTIGLGTYAGADVTDVAVDTSGVTSTPFNSTASSTQTSGTSGNIAITDQTTYTGTADATWTLTTADGTNFTLDKGDGTGPQALTFTSGKVTVEGLELDHSALTVASGDTWSIDVTAAGTNYGGTVTVGTGADATTFNVNADGTTTAADSAQKYAGLAVSGATATGTGAGSFDITGRTAGTTTPVVGINVSTQAAADSAITVINDAIKTVSTERSKLGAYQNRLDHTINNLNTSSENLTAAESRVRDVDYALAA